MNVFLYFMYISQYIQISNSQFIPPQPLPHPPGRRRVLTGALKQWRSLRRGPCPDGSTQAECQGVRGVFGTAGRFCWEWVQRAAAADLSPSCQPLTGDQRGPRAAALARAGRHRRLPCRLLAHRSGWWGLGFPL